MQTAAARAGIIGRMTTSTTRWEEPDDQGRTVSCRVTPHEEGGYRVALAIDGEPTFGVHCPHLEGAGFIATAWRRDTLRTSGRDPQR